MNTDTPRTDEAAVNVWRKSNGERMATSSDKVDADFARKLERELNDARAEMIRWMSIAEGRGRTDDDEQLATAESQLASYKARYIKLAGKYAIETHEITAQRDEARAETIRTREFMDYGFAKAQEELTDMTAQRDRLAEALRKVSRSWNYAEVAQQALQSLIHKP
jgi:hypothetical protein